MIETDTNIIRNFKKTDNYITLNKLKDIYEIAKTLKCDIIMAQGDKIFGTDVDFVHLKCVRGAETDLNAIFFMKDLAEFIKTSDDNIVDSCAVIYIFNYIQVHYEFFEQFLNLIGNAEAYSKLPVTAYNEDLKSNPDFNTINDMKAADGIGLLKLSEKYILTLFSGLVPSNKADKVKVYIRDIDEYRYLVNFSVVKKKFTIDIYFMYLFLR